MNLYFQILLDYKFSEDQIATMDAVLDYYGDKQPQWLSELTHKEMPWKIARGRGMLRENDVIKLYLKVICNYIMEDLFSGKEKTNE